MTMRRLLMCVLMLVPVAGWGDNPAQQADDEDSFTIATGSVGGTYNTMLTQMSKVCSGYVPKIRAKAPTEGSVKNIELLLNNEVNAAFVQADVLFWYDKELGKIGDRIKTVYALHHEALHYVAPVQSHFKKGRILKDVVEFNDVTDLNGYEVGIVDGSGSAISAGMFADKAGLNYNLHKYDSAAAMKKGLDSGEVAAIVMVGGQPLKDVADFGKDYKLLAVPPNVQERVAKYYDAVKLNYSTLNARGTPTVATQAYLVSRSYHDKDMLATLAAIRQCLDDKLGKIQDTPKTHAAWADVTINSDDKTRGRWTWYNLPAPQQDTPAPQPAAVSNGKKKRS